MSIKASSSSRMGEYLLKGHIMTAEGCPDCQIPLMRDPATRIGLCVNCDAQYREDGTRVETGAHQQALSSQQATNAPPSAAVPAPTEPLSPSATTNLQSPRSDHQRQRPVPSPGPKDDEVAEAIASKLQRGWALLDTLCPRCNTPLVRDRANRRMFCCSCDMWVLTEQQMADQPLASPSTPQAGAPPSPGAAQAAVTGTQTTRQAPASSAIAALPNGPHMDSGTHSAVTREIKQEPVDPNTLPPTGPVHRHSQGAGASGAGMAVYSRLEAAVTQQLADVSHMMESTSLMYGGVAAVDSLERLLRLAGGCLSVLEQLSSRQGH